MSGGCVDVQVNGYGGVDFNQDDLNAEGLHSACATLRRDGVEKVLATIITADLATMAHRLRRLAELREQDPLVQELIAGLHVEGPFLSPEVGFRGAHPEAAIRPAAEDDMSRLLDAGGGLVRMVTLAPEHDANLAVTRRLADRGILVSAGHCDPSLETLDAAIDAGLSVFTHLGNGCPGMLARHENIVQRAISRAGPLTLCFIADGAHVPFFALGNYLRAAGLEHCLVTSDAIAPAGLGPGRFTMAHWELLIGEDLVARAPDASHLVGSAISLPRARQNLVTQLGLSEAQAQALTRDNPAALLARARA